jgi:hypothetical protein
MPATWPSSLPQQFLQGTYTESLGETRLRSQTEFGPAKIRRRTTSTPGIIQGDMYMTSDEFAILVEFYQQTLLTGTLVFEWVHPWLRVPMRCRFQEPFTWSRVDLANVIVHLSLENLP